VCLQINARTDECKLNSPSLTRQDFVGAFKSSRLRKRHTHKKMGNHKIDFVQSAKWQELYRSDAQSTAPNRCWLPNDVFIETTIQINFLFFLYSNQIYVHIFPSNIYNVFFLLLLFVYIRLIYTICFKLFAKRIKEKASKKKQIAKHRQVYLYVCGQKFKLNGTMTATLVTL
jgi:hypothetical protein